MQPDRWLGVEIRHLIALEAVAREGSFGGAARALGYTQSAISQQIATLERIVGEKLIERPGGPRRVSLTESGELLLRHARAIVDRLSAAEADLHALAEGEAGALRIGVYQSVGQHVLPAILRRFVEEWPRVAVSLEEEADDTKLLDLVERGELDLTFADMPLPEGPFEHVEVLRDPYVLVVPADSELADLAEPVGLEDVVDLDLIGFRNCRGTTQIERTLPLPLQFAFRSDHNGTVQALVGAGFGAALMPRLTIDANDPSVTLLELENVPPRLIAMTWHRDRHRGPAARAFVELAREVSADLGAATLEL
ncbi:MAG TPA: LysR family transcriptional regulator [Gaiellaceae bacterium]|jgi:DNA-binding transcriptional LysR family regulator|nr:LysR family transcriptional regulator [Gaiellaceae bacterium]